MSMNNEAREKLRELVEELGTNVADNPQKWRGYLTDRLAPHRRERQAIITALNENVPEELLISQVSVSPQIQVDRLTQRLVNDLGLQPEVGRWAVESWAIALGVLSPGALPTTAVSESATSDSKLPKRAKSGSVTQVETRQKRRWIAGLLAAGAIAAVSISAYSVYATKQQSNPVVAQGGGGSGKLLATNSLTVGVYVPPRRTDQKNRSDQAQNNGSAPDAQRFNPQDGYQKFADYLKSSLKDRLRRDVDVKVEFIEATGRDSFDQVKAKLNNKEWDVAFTFNPLLSAVAIESQYDFAARMFRGANDELHPALITRNDSPIKTLDDLNRRPDTTIALQSADTPAFYVSVYDSYGRTLRVDLDNPSPRSAMDKVLNQQADVGVGYAEFLTGDLKNVPPQFQQRAQRYRNELRIISASRGIPTAGVYLSPSLSGEERDTIKKAMLEAPEDIRRAGRYNEGTPGDYSELLRIVKRVDEVLACTDPTKWAPNDRITFSCTGASVLSGKVNGVSHADENTEHLNLQADDGKMYRVTVPKKVMSEAGLPPIVALNSKRISIINVKPDDQSRELRVTEAKQIKLLAERS